jgi:hypothetical protein
MSHANKCHIINEDINGDMNMLGINDPQIWLAYLLSIGSALGCIIYGLIHWNDTDPEEEN